jgi:hypothetical protein
VRHGAAISCPRALTHRPCNTKNRGLDQALSDSVSAARCTALAIASTLMLVAIVAANLQHLSGKPWAMTALIHPIESAKPVLIEPRGTRRLSSQTLLDVRVSRAFRFRDAGRVEVSLTC